MKEKRVINRERERERERALCWTNTFDTLHNILKSPNTTLFFSMFSKNTQTETNVNATKYPLFIE